MSAKWSMDISGWDVARVDVMPMRRAERIVSFMLSYVQCPGFCVTWRCLWCFQKKDRVSTAFYTPMINSAILDKEGSSVPKRVQKDRSPVFLNARSGSRHQWIALFPSCPRTSIATRLPRLEIIRIRSLKYYSEFSNLNFSHPIVHPFDNSKRLQLSQLHGVAYVIGAYVANETIASARKPTPIACLTPRWTPRLSNR